MKHIFRFNSGYALCGVPETDNDPDAPPCQPCRVTSTVLSTLRREE